MLLRLPTAYYGTISVPHDRQTHLYRKHLLLNVGSDRRIGLAHVREGHERHDLSSKHMRANATEIRPLPHPWIRGLRIRCAIKI